MVLTQILVCANIYIADTAEDSRCPARDVSIKEEAFAAD